MLAIDSRNTGILSLRQRMEEKWKGSRTIEGSSIRVHPAIRVHLQHNSAGEYYEAFLSYNWMNDCYMLSLSFHGKDNQGRPYCHPSCGVKRYKHLSLAFQQVEIMTENKNRLNRWIQRNSK